MPSSSAISRRWPSRCGPWRADCADALKGRPTFDFIEDFASKYTVRVLFAALGLPLGGDEATVRDKAVLMVQSDPKTRAKSAAHIAAFDWVRDYAAKVIAERRAKPANDLISHFAAAEIDGDRLDEREVLLTTTTLIMAGVELLGGFMAMLAYNLARFPDVRRACVADPARLPDAIEESLRYNTSAQRFRRCLAKDVELHGRTMRAGDFVCLAYGSGNRDERHFADADVYNLDRRPQGHLGFGGGVHACLGATIARHGDTDRDGGIPSGGSRLRPGRRRPGVALDAVLDLPQSAGLRTGGRLGPGHGQDQLHRAGRPQRRHRCPGRLDVDAGGA